jgi:hypothetical protein
MSNKTIKNLIEELVTERLESGSKTLSFVKENSERIKYGRTFHLPWSLGATDDDKTHGEDDLDTIFGGKEVIVTEKLDGENTSIYSDGTCHARSLDSANHPSRTYVRAKAAQIGCDLPKGWRLVGENLFAKHSIDYENLPDYFIIFGIVDNNNIARSWDEVEEWSQLLEIPHVPVIYRGIWDPDKIKKLYPFSSKMGGKQAEGYVVRMADSFPMSEMSYNLAKFVRKDHVAPNTVHWQSATVVPNKLKKKTDIDEAKKDDGDRDEREIPVAVNFTGDWKRPDQKHIQDQVELAACLNKMDYKSLVSKIFRAKPEYLDDSTWAKLDNTNSFRVGNVDLAKDLADRYGYHYNDALFGYMNNRDMTMPVILNVNNGEEYYTVSGEPELLFARAFKVEPKVLMIKI